jgi:cbb3-type cytochrome oxidase maturation protein
MDVVILLVFISLMLVAAALAFFIYRLREGDFEHGDRLSLAPLNNDEPAPERTPHPSESRPDRSTEEPKGGSQHASC